MSSVSRALENELILVQGRATGAAGVGVGSGSQGSGGMGNLCTSRDRPRYDERYLKYVDFHAQVRKVALDPELLHAECEETVRHCRSLSPEGHMPKEELYTITQRFIDGLHCDDPQRLQQIARACNDLCSTYPARPAVSFAEFVPYTLAAIWGHFAAFCKDLGTLCGVLLRFGVVLPRPAPFGGRFAAFCGVWASFCGAVDATACAAALRADRQ